MPRWEGILAPMVTPLTPALKIDRAGVEALTERLIAGGVSGLFVLGSTGEGPLLPPERQQEMLEATLAAAAGRAPVLAGIASASPEESLRLGRAAVAAGAAAVVAPPPCYCPESEEELFRFYRTLSANIDAPLFVYNMPELTKIDLAPELVARLAELPGIAGYKDSSGNMSSLHRVLRLTGEIADFAVFVGPELLMAEAVLFGAAGGVNGGANLCPELFAETWRAARAGDLDRVRVLQRRIVDLQRLYRFGAPGTPGCIAGLKAALALEGVIAGTPLPPAEAPDADTRTAIEAWLAEWKKSDR